MIISRRTSGGRGEYEISGEHDGRTPADIFNRAITLVIADGWMIRTETSLVLQGGKPRLRLDRPDLIQLHRQLAAAVMMPLPVRAQAAFGDGLPVLRKGAYAIESIPLRDVRLVGGNAVQLSVGEVLVDNSNHHEEPIHFRRRAQEVAAIWDGAPELPPELGELVNQHRALVQDGGPIPREAEGVVSRLQRLLSQNADDYGTGGSEDVVPDLLTILRWRPAPPSVRVEDVAPDQLDIRRRVKKQWQAWVTRRGPDSRRFKERVQAAYRSTCLFCGICLPRAETVVASPGVDSAHILPWADYDLDHVANGVCCCKLHHWAFDEGLLVLRWESERGQYVVEVPAEKVRLLRRRYPRFDVDELLRIAGPVPDSRLPARRQDRPNPECLARLYESE